MQATSLSKRILYPPNTSFPTAELPPTSSSRSEVAPDVLSAFRAQQSVPFELPSQTSDHSEDSCPSPEDQETDDEHEPSPSQSVSVTGHSEPGPSRRHQQPSPKIFFQDRNLIRNLAPGEGLRLGYGPANGPHFVRIPHPGTRDRINRACDKCRGRKTKCTGEKPTCNRCFDRKLECTYSEPRVRGPSRYQIFLRRQKALQEELCKPIPLAPRRELPPHLLAFDPRVKAQQQEEDQRRLDALSSYAAVTSLLAGTADRQIWQQYDQVRFALPDVPPNPVCPVSEPETIATEPVASTSSHLEQFPAKPYQLFALPGVGPPESFPDASVSSTNADYVQEHELDQYRHSSACPSAGTPGVDIFGDDCGMLFTPPNNMISENAWAPAIDVDYNLGTGSMDNLSSMRGLSVSDPLSHSPINLPPPLNNTNPSGVDWLLVKAHEARKNHDDAICTSPVPMWLLPDPDYSRQLVPVSSAPSTSGSSNSPSSALSGSLPTTPSSDIEVAYDQDRDKSQISSAVTCDERSEEPNVKDSVTIFDNKTGTEELALSPSMVFDFESYERS